MPDLRLQSIECHRRPCTQALTAATLVGHVHAEGSVRLCAVQTECVLLQRRQVRSNKLILHQVSLLEMSYPNRHSPIGSPSDVPVPCISSIPTSELLMPPLLRAARMTAFRVSRCKECVRLLSDRWGMDAGAQPFGCRMKPGLGHTGVK